FNDEEENTLDGSRDEVTDGRNDSRKRYTYGRQKDDTIVADEDGGNGLGPRHSPTK
ncbi:MAG: hypothetical protein L6R36_008517, partial [Xanthoria steineri]